MAIRSMQELVANIPSREDIAANAQGALVTMFKEAQQNFDILAMGRSIAASISGVSENALPAADLGKGKGQGWGIG